jgi:alpha-beta hydrolase superfamily lysophospholipase
MDRLRTEDGLELVTRQWPAAQPARGTVLLVHGLGEHAARYVDVGALLSQAGWAVEAFDLRGHGRSPGPRGGLPRADAMLSDLSRAVQRVRARHTGPLVLLGHSMGGLLAARFVAEALQPQPAPWSCPVEALVLSSPALDPGMSAFQRFLLRLGAWMPDRALSNGLKPAWISRDPQVVQAYRQDALVHDRVTPRLVQAIVDDGVLVRERAPVWRTPTLLLYAGADRCVAPAGSAAFAQAAPPSVVHTRCYPGLYHEIFNEPEREQVLSELLRWLAARPFASH